MILEGVIVFAAGLLMEAVGVFWTHYAERGAAAKVGVLSVVLALALSLGVTESVHNARLILPFALGHGLGSYIAVRLKSSLGKRG